MTCPHCGALVGRLKRDRGAGVGKKLIGLGLLAGVLVVFLGTTLYRFTLGGEVSGGALERVWKSDWDLAREALIRQAEAAALAGDYSEVVRLCDSRNSHGDPLIKILRDHAVAELEKMEVRSVSAHSDSE